MQSHGRSGRARSRSGAAGSRRRITERKCHVASGSVRRQRSQRCREHNVRESTHRPHGHDHVVTQ
jgi:hypothetical protein